MTEETAAGASAPGPLAEASASSLDEYFSRRPPFDGECLAKMVSEFRRMREKWESLGEGVKATKKAPAKKAPAASAQLSADELWGDEPGKAP